MLTACLLTGCASPGSNAPGASGTSATAALAPFSPASLRIHPLTHIEPAEGDRAMLILHVEVLDAYADAIKSLGTLRVDVYKPGAGVAPGIETQTLAWDVAELADAETNVRRFDRTTRTYRLPLRGPAWMSAWLDREIAAREGRPAWLKVRAVFEPRTSECSTRAASLRDEFVVQR
jgi:hypothetical protein